MRAAFRADQFLPGCDSQGRLEVVPVGAAMDGKPGVHEPQIVEQFGACAESAAYSRNARALMKRERGGNVLYFVHGCL